MKIYKKISVAASIMVVAAMSSCSDKGYWDERPLEQGYSLQCATYNETLAPGANEIKIQITRSVNTSQESVNVSFTPSSGCPADITVQSPVVFEAGSNVATVVVNIANATPPYTYAGTLQFDGTPSYSGISKCTLKCPVSYTWESIGTGTFYDAWVMDNADAPYNVEIMQAVGFTRYRVMNPYKEYYTTIGPESWNNWIASTGPAYIEFWELDNGNLMFNSYSLGMNYDGDASQPINAYPWNSFSSGTAEGFDIWYSPGFAVLTPSYYINGVGGWLQQTYALQIELP